MPLPRAARRLAPGSGYDGPGRARGPTMSDTPDPRAEEALGPRLRRPADCGRLLGYLAPTGPRARRARADGGLLRRPALRAGGDGGGLRTSIWSGRRRRRRGRRSGISRPWRTGSPARGTSRADRGTGRGRGLWAASWRSPSACSGAGLRVAAHGPARARRRAPRRVRQAPGARSRLLRPTPVGRLVCASHRHRFAQRAVHRRIVSIVRRPAAAGRHRRGSLRSRLAVGARRVLDPALLFALTVWFKSRARASFREVRLEVARLAGFLQEHVTGMPVVQLFGREARAFDEFQEINRAHSRRQHPRHPLLRRLLPESRS